MVALGVMGVVVAWGVVAADVSTLAVEEGVWSTPVLAIISQYSQGRSNFALLIFTTS